MKISKSKSNSVIQAKLRYLILYQKFKSLNLLKRIKKILMILNKEQMPWKHKWMR